MRPRQIPPGEWGGPRRPPTPPADPATAPDDVRRAVRLMYAGAALSAIDVLGAALLYGGSFGPVVAATTRALVAAALWCWMARANGRGLPWARTLATVFGVLNVLGTAYVAAFTLVTGITPLWLALWLPSAGLAVAILVLLRRPASSRFFDRLSW